MDQDIWTHRTPWLGQDRWCDTCIAAHVESEAWFCGRLDIALTQSFGITGEIPTAFASRSEYTRVVPEMFPVDSDSEPD